MNKKLVINWGNFIFVIFCFIALLPIAINAGLFIGNNFLFSRITHSVLNVVFTSTTFAAGILLTHQTISYLYLNQLSTKPIFYILPFLLIALLNAATSVILFSAIKFSIVSLLIVLTALLLGGVVLRNYNLLKFRIAIIVASVILFLLGVSLAIYTVAWIVSLFKIFMCVMFFFRIILASNYLVRFQENKKISEKQVWLSTRLVNETIFVYIAILSNILT